MTVDLKAIRERDAKQASMPTLHLKCGHDRAQLLALIDNVTVRMKDALELITAGENAAGVRRFEEIIRDLDGDARGGGR